MKKQKNKGRPGTSGKACSIRLHSARSSEGRVIWPEIQINGRDIEDIESLRKEVGQKARLEWFLISRSGIRSVIFDDDPRIENGGFLLRIQEREARVGVRAECVLMLDEEDGAA